MSLKKCFISKMYRNRIKNFDICRDLFSANPRVNFRFVLDYYVGVLCGIPLKSHFASGIESVREGGRFRGTISFKGPLSGVNTKKKGWLIG